MKTEQEIRDYCRLLFRFVATPCDHRHRDPAQAAECHTGRLMMAAVRDALLWAVGDHPEYERAVIDPLRR